MSPHRTIPTVLHIIIGIMATSIQWLGIVHISTEHISIKILRQLKGPVLAFAIIIIKINTLLNNAQTNTMVIVIRFQIFIGNACQIGIVLSELGSTGYQYRPYKQRQKNHILFHHFTPPPL